MSSFASPTGRLLCIGDVHGCAPELETLLAEIDLRPEDRPVFLGDYVDRGPQSQRCVAILVDVRARFPQAIFLRGNHEDMLLDYLGLGGGYGEFFLMNGGTSTLRSYGITPAGRHAPSKLETRAAFPPEQLEFLEHGLRLSFSDGGYSFVHAGVRPGVPLAEQATEDLLWIREPFVSSETGLPTTVVFGHTPLRDVLFDVPAKIGLDTGCVYGGKLSCLDLTQGILHQVKRGARAAARRDVRDQLADRIGSARR